MNTRRHFHSFDALRFLAFFKVFLLHLPVFSFPVFSFLKKGGGIGVIFFFVLSGFLITYILLDEKQKTQTIDLRRFYIRRILRIWPLYYLMVLFAFLSPYILDALGLPSGNEGYQPNWLMTLTFLENYKMMATGSHPNVSPLGVSWTLCIEEQFYIVWGLMLYRINIRSLPYLFLGCIFIAFISRYFYNRYQIPLVDLPAHFDYFIYGAIPAFFLVKNPLKFENWISNFQISTRLLIILILIIYVVLSPNIQYPFQYVLEPLIFGLGFCFLICSILPLKNPLKISDKNILSRLGTYTYGLYFYHTIIIIFLFQVFKKTGISIELPINAVLYSLLCLALSILVSVLSYHLFEKYFLKLKKYFEPGNPLTKESVTGFAGSNPET
jgi:peptidoglycan/LPS O-acetylase OafA/YrhL